MMSGLGLNYNCFYVDIIPELLLPVLKQEQRIKIYHRKHTELIKNNSSIAYLSIYDNRCKRHIEEILAMAWVTNIASRKRVIVQTKRSNK